MKLPARASKTSDRKTRPPHDPRVLTEPWTPACQGPALLPLLFLSIAGFQCPWIPHCEFAHSLQLTCNLKINAQSHFPVIPRPAEVNNVHPLCARPVGVKQQDDPASRFNSQAVSKGSFRIYSVPHFSHFYVLRGDFAV